MALPDAFAAPWLCSGRLACPGGEAEALIASSPFFKSDVVDLVGLIAGFWSFAWTDVPATSSNRARLAGRAFTTPLLPEPPAQALDCSIPSRRIGTTTCRNLLVGVNDEMPSRAAHRNEARS